MKWLLFFSVILLIVVSCHIRSTTCEDPTRAWLHVWYEEDLFFEEVLDESDDSQSFNLDLPDNSNITIDKIVNINYEYLPEEEESEEVSRSCIVLAKKADYYTQFAQGSYLDTLIINASGGFTPVVPGVVCGTIYSTQHYPI